MQYLRARYYAPKTGRFTTRDPFGGVLSEPGTLAAYPYALNNPILYSDPSGEFVETVLDVAFVGYDLYTVGDKIYRGCEVLPEDWLALGLDALSLVLPVVPAVGGLMVRTVVRGNDIVGIVRSTGKLDDILKISFLDIPKRVNWSHHHLLPQRFRTQFANLGIDIDKYLVSLPKDLHDKIHAGPRGGLWNNEWENWLSNNPHSTAQEVFTQIGVMIHKFGLDGYIKIIP